MDENEGTPTPFLPRYEAIDMAFKQTTEKPEVKSPIQLWLYGFLSGAFIVVIINLIYMLITR